MSSTTYALVCQANTLMGEATQRQTILVPVSYTLPMRDLAVEEVKLSERK